MRRFSQHILQWHKGFHKKNTTWNNDLFHDSIDNYGTFEKLIADAKTRRYKASTVCSNRYKHNISHWPHPEFYGLFNSVTKFIGISNLRRPIQKITIPWIIILKHTIQSLKIIQQAKIDYNANLFNLSKSNIRHTWSVVKLNKCKNKREFPNYFVIDGHEIKAHTDISNCFNLFFSRVGPDPTNSINFTYLCLKFFLLPEMKYILITGIYSYWHTLSEKNNQFVIEKQLWIWRYIIEAPQLYFRVYWRTIASNQ